MGKSAMVRACDVLKVSNLCAELVETAGLSTRRYRVADLMTRMLGAQVGAVSEASGFAAGGDPHFRNAIAVGWIGPVEQQEFGRYMSTEDHCVDPNLRPLARRSSSLVTVRRCDLVADRDWYGTYHVSEERHLARVDDVIYSVTPLKYGKAGEVQMLAVHRPWGDRTRFTARDRTVLNLIHRATVDLIEVQPAIGNRLPPRLARTFDLLLTALSEKEIASRLRLTRHTVHGYVKEIYSITGVRSRAELMVRFGDQATPRPSLGRG